MLTAAGMLGALAGVLAGCGGAPAPPPPAAAVSPVPRTGAGVDPGSQTVRLLLLTDLSGPGARRGKAITAAQEAYFARLDETGGLDGWQVQLLVADTHGDPSLALRDYKRLSGSFAMVAQSLGAAVTAAIEPQAVRDSMLVGTATQNIDFTRSPVNAVLGPPYEADAANALGALPPQARRSDRFGIIYAPDAYGRQVLTGYTTAVATYRLHDAGRLAYRPGAALTRDLRRLQLSGANQVYLATRASTTAAVLAGARAIGYHPHWILDERAWSPWLVSTTGAQGGRPTPVAGMLTGAWVAGYQAPWGDLFATGMLELLKVRQTFAPSQVPDLNYVYGYCLADMERKVLGRAIRSGELTPAAILAAKRTFGNVDLRSLMPVANYSAAGGPVTMVNDVFVVDPSRPGLLRVRVPYFTSRAAMRLPR